MKRLSKKQRKKRRNQSLKARKNKGGTKNLTEGQKLAAKMKEIAEEKRNNE